MLVVRYLIALVFSIFVVATSLRIEERHRGRGNGDYKISTPDRLVLQMQPQQRDGKQLQRRRLIV